jgi:hypothetical protein
MRAMVEPAFSPKGPYGETNADVSTGSPIRQAATLVETFSILAC